MSGNVLSEEQTILRATVRRLAEAHLAPKAAHWDATETPPLENMALLRDHGLVGVGIAEEWGGNGGTLLDLVLVIEEVARGCPNTAFFLTATASVAVRGILALGSDAMKARHLPGLISGQKIGGWSMTEANAGSDVGAIATNAVRDGDHYVINGAKMFCTFGTVADLILVLLRIDGIEGTRGIGAMLVEAGTPGFSAGRPIPCMGLRATGMSELVFTDCRVAAENLLVPAGGLRDLLSVMDADRIVSNPPVALGIAQAAFDAALGYVQDRRQFGQAIADFQGIQWMLADMAMDLEAARALLYRAAERFDEGAHAILDASMAKTAVNEMAVRVTNQALQLHGTFGYTRDFPVERHLRDARGLAIGYGTTQIQRNAIAREILKGRYVV